MTRLTTGTALRAIAATDHFTANAGERVSSTSPHKGLCTDARAGSLSVMRDETIGSFLTRLAARSAAPGGGATGAPAAVFDSIVTMFDIPAFSVIVYTGCARSRGLK